MFSILFQQINLVYLILNGIKVTANNLVCIKQFCRLVIIAQMLRNEHITIMGSTVFYTVWYLHFNMMLHTTKLGTYHDVVDNCIYYPGKLYTYIVVCVCMYVCMYVLYGGFEICRQMLPHIGIVWNTCMRVCIHVSRQHDKYISHVSYICILVRIHAMVCALRFVCTRCAYILV